MKENQSEPSLSYSQAGDGFSFVNGFAILVKDGESYKATIVRLSDFKSDGQTFTAQIEGLVQDTKY